MLVVRAIELSTNKMKAIYIKASLHRTKNNRSYTRNVNFMQIRTHFIRSGNILNCYSQQLAIEPETWSPSIDLVLAPSDLMKHMPSPAMNVKNLHFLLP